jgi:ubiquitin-activating enzyme E1
MIQKTDGIYITTNGYHNFSDGDKVKFTKYSGKNVDFLESEFKVETVKPNIFKIKSENSTDKEFKLIHGNVQKIKESVKVSFNCYGKERDTPSLLDDWINPDKPKENFDYWMSNKLNPEDELELSPVNGYFGGLIASESIKFLTNKYQPISQWYFWEDTSYLSYDESGRNMVEKIVGKETYEKLINSKLFMVGSGAIGCEMLKNLSMLNVSTGVRGKFIVTDPDTIEVSNLSRQFLFHSENVNDSKSIVAGKKVKEFKPNFNVECYQDKMSKESDEKYDDKFYESLDGIVNALDNYQARLFMDKKAVEYGLPLFESGTQGAKGNTQPVIPKLTENYGATSDPPESESYPLCTVKNFPNKPEHVIHYMKEMYEEWFSDFAYKVNDYLENPDMLDDLTDTERNDLVGKMNSFFKYSSDWEGQIKFWNEFYYSHFRDNILQILNNYPEDHKIDGDNFWSGAKKCPKVPSDDYRLSFIESSVKMSERLLGKVFKKSESDLIKYINTLEIPETNISNKKVALEEKDLEEQNKMDDVVLKVEPISLIPQSYDKDRESDYTWMYYGSLIRATSYQMEFPDMLKMRQISGKIIPAMATTTSMVSGLISLELIKYYQDKKIDDYRSYFLNLALNQYLYSEPNPVQKDKFGSTEVSVWDKFSESVNITIGDIIEKYGKIFDTEITIVVSDDKIIYAPFVTDEEEKETKLSELGSKYTLLLSDDDETNYPPIYVNVINRIEEE